MLHKMSKYGITCEKNNLNRYIYIYINVVHIKIKRFTCHRCVFQSLLSEHINAIREKKEDNLIVMSVFSAALKNELRKHVSDTHIVRNLQKCKYYILLVVLSYFGKQSKYFWNVCYNDVIFIRIVPLWRFCKSFTIQYKQVS